MPGFDFFADLVCGAEQGDVFEPAVGEHFGDVFAAVFVDGFFDIQHFLFVAGFFPVVAVVRQEGVAGQGAAVDGFGGGEVVADAGWDHVGDHEGGVVAFCFGQGGEGGFHVA